ncbi:MAG: cyclodeaminase/cyclohydrolase family protein [Actinomycetota bacterium]
MTDKAMGEHGITEWLAVLASDAATPGGGAYAALSAAAGAALISMTARLTVRKKDFADVADRMQLLIDEADDARGILLELADRDAHAFDRVMAAYRMPRESEDERSARLRELQSALEGAAEVPLDVARRSVYLMGLAEEATTNGNPNAASDGMCAAAALHAATIAALANVQINAFAFVDETHRGELIDDVARLRGRADGLLADVEEAFRQRLEGQ